MESHRIYIHNRLVVIKRFITLKSEQSRPINKKLFPCQLSHEADKKHSRTLTGFTLIEMLIVMGVVSIMIAFSLFIDLNDFRGDAFRSETSMIVTLLQTARADALNNIDQSAHGVAIYPSDHPESYVIFEGLTYASRDTSTDEVIDASYQLNVSSGSITEVDFGQLSGDAMNGDIIVEDPQRKITKDISINSEGRISW